MLCGDHGIELLVQKIAYKMMRALPPSVQIEDLFQSGMVGWIVAKRKYDESLDIPFNRFAVLYIRSAMIDSLREGSWAPRITWKHQRAINDVKKKLTEQGMHDPSDKQIAECLNIPVTQYHKITLDLFNIYFSDLGDQIEELPSEEDIYEKVLQIYKYQNLRTAINMLSSVENKFIRMRYDEDVSIINIARHLNITESKSRTILKNSLNNLKKIMRDWML